MRKAPTTLMLLAGLWSAAPPLSAADRLDLRESREVPLTLALATLASWGSSLLVQRPECSWCDGDASGRDTLNGFDSRLRWKSLSPAARRSAHKASNVLLAVSAVGMGVVAPALHHESVGLKRALWEDLLVCGETAAATSALTTFAKHSFGRQRPYAHFGEPIYGSKQGEDNLSFFSGHASEAFATVVCGYRLEKQRGDRLAKPALFIGLGMATATAVLRVRADKHYASDVLVGAAVGSVVGYLWPRRFFGPVRPAVAPTAGGVALGVEASW